MLQFLSSHRFCRYFIVLAVTAAIAYGGGRLYYQLTDGFVPSNIACDRPFDSRWEVTPLSAEKKEKLDVLLAQPYDYLGKGCQSYVFASRDGQYVLKFFKYQRFRPQEWLSYFSFIPAVKNYYEQKIEKKKEKLDGVFTSWKMAYESLQPETGVIYVHLNKNQEFGANLTIYDKLNFQHSIDLNKTEFLVQRKAEMLCPTLDALMEKNKGADAQKILSKLISMLVLENARGFADNDHALMQNTGVLNGRPIHIDVGQFIYNPIVKNPKVYHQEIFNKTYKFHRWLEKKHPTLSHYLEQLLVAVIGEPFWKMTPAFYTADMARIPNARERAD